MWLKQKSEMCSVYLGLHPIHEEAVLAFQEMVKETIACHGEPRGEAGKQICSVQRGHDDFESCSVPI
jgi:hypothetical protein